jgi:hypothetical protein
MSMTSTARTNLRRGLRLALAGGRGHGPHGGHRRGRAHPAGSSGRRPGAGASLQGGAQA